MDSELPELEGTNSAFQDFEDNVNDLIDNDQNFLKEPFQDVLDIVDDLIDNDPGRVQDQVMHLDVEMNKRDDDISEENVTNIEKSKVLSDTSSVPSDTSSVLSDSDHISKTRTICLTTTVKTFPDGRKEELRHTSISHYKHLNIDDFNVAEIAMDILKEGPRHLITPAIHVKNSDQ